MGGQVKREELGPTPISEYKVVGAYDKSGSQYLLLLLLHSASVTVDCLACRRRRLRVHRRRDELSINQSINISLLASK